VSPRLQYPHATITFQTALKAKLILIRP
jgi:hypothetical protein